MILKNFISDEAISFKFSTLYKGKKINLIIVPMNDRFVISSGKNLFGQIKIGADRHTWYVANSKYIEYELVNDIAKRIIENL